MTKKMCDKMYFFIIKTKLIYRFKTIKLRNIKFKIYFVQFKPSALC